jgi:pimeloyl-ACP methyl ester carboxylesterase
MTTFVLVHGAVHGGWCWKKVRPLLRAAGHDVYTPTLTGLGERAHLAHPGIDLATHIQDVVAVVEYEDLREAVLVGHSYAGLVITGVADRLPDRLAHLVYLDAMVPRDGEAGLDLFTREEQADRRARVAAEGGGWRLLPPADPAVLGVTAPDDVAWVRPRLTAHPFPTFTQPIRLTNPALAAVPKTFIHCTEAPPTHWRAVSLERVRSEPGWRTYELATGHDAMVTRPRELADLLLAIARPAR